MLSLLFPITVGVTGGSPRLSPAHGHRLKHDLPSTRQGWDWLAEATVAVHPQCVTLGL